MEAETSSRDLLQSFAGTAAIPGHAPPETTASEEIELSLSLGGGFSANPREKTTLIRSSSISAFPFLELKEENESSSVRLGPTQVLHRTCSLPVPGPDEEYRRRKEMQSLKRMEAKRKRDEKKNGLNSKGEEHVQCAGSRRGLPPLSQGSIGSMGGSNSTGGMIANAH